MLRNLDELHNFTLHANDGAIGHVTDFYFDDQAWVIRYLVVETGNWLSSRKVLISPMSIGPPDWKGKTLPVSLSREQIQNSPNIDTDKPVSRQHEQDFLTHYAYPLYWIGTGLWGDDAHPARSMPEFVSTPSVVQPQPDHVPGVEPEVSGSPANTHLHSSNVVTGYRLHADDGEIGHMRGVLIDEVSWAIRYFVVSTSYWQVGHQALIMPASIASIDGSDSVVLLNLSSDKMQQAPSHHHSMQVNRAHEAHVHSHYDIRPYWMKEPELADPDPMLGDRDEALLRIRG